MEQCMAGPQTAGDMASCSHTAKTVHSWSNARLGLGTAGRGHSWATTHSWRRSQLDPCLAGD